ncbi:hypothetical protein N658DRAFT_522093 [Parathielavia hyrcaniae]|uniref:Uncharacterized protein n=1 Tax=Parathielavia hyrcaniae TaxID=113614 RepID=A0AAN6Q4F0_9PEZI|nr:hypothetical protein N658DRAFT_522093 [Parathielavia hyrcaniae]
MSTSVTCPSAAFGCYYAIDMGGLFCMSADYDVVTQGGLCGNLVAGTVYACGQQQQAGGGGTTTSSSSGSGTGAGTGTGAGSGVSGTGSDSGSGSGSGSGGGGGDSTSPNQGSRMMGSECGLMSGVVAVLATAFLLL